MGGEAAQLSQHRTRLPRLLRWTQVTQTGSRCTGGSVLPTDGASGHLDAGEDYADAAIREIDEELGISGVGGLEECARLPASPNTGWEFVVLFATRSSGKVRYPCSEVETGDFYPLSLIRRWVDSRPSDFAPGFIECFRAFEAKGESRAF